MKLPSSLTLLGGQHGSSLIVSNEAASALQKAAEFSTFHAFREAAWLALNIIETVQKTRFIHPYYTILTETVCYTTQEVINYDLPLSKTMHDNAANLVRILRAVNELVLTASSQSWCHKHFLTNRDFVAIERLSRNLYSLNTDPTGIKSKCLCNFPTLSRLDLYGSVCELVSRVFNKSQPRDKLSSAAKQSLISYFFYLVSLALSRTYFILLLGLPSYYASRASCMECSSEPDFLPSRQSIEIVDLDSDIMSSSSPAPLVESPTVNAWISLCHSLVEEWKAFRVLSALTLGAGLALFQIPSVNSDLLICFSAYFTLICMLMSTIYATIDIIYFKSWKDVRVIANWFHEIQRSGHRSAWNAWILFALPALWAAWGAFFFLICIFLLVWRSNPDAGSLDPSIPVPSTSLEELMGFRISLTVVMVLALMYLALTLVTFRRIQRDSKEYKDAVGGMKGAHAWV